MTEDFEGEAEERGKSRRLTRRHALAAAAGAAVAAGGVGYVWSRLRRRPPDSIESYEMMWSLDEELDPDDEHGLVEEDGDLPHWQEYDGPAFDVDREERRVTADGFFMYGSTSCFDHGFWGFRDDDTVTAVITTERIYSEYLRNPLGWGCTADFLVKGYRLIVDFSELPREFAVEEHHSTGTEKTIVNPRA